MPFNVEEFKSRIAFKNSFQRTNKFLVTFAPPRVLLGRRQETIASMRFWAMTANLPGYAMASNEVRRYTYGPAEKRPFGPAFEDISLGIMSDVRQDNWDLFHTWTQAIIPHDMRNGIDSLNTPIGQITRAAPYELEYRENYVTDLNIVAYDESGKATLQVVCREAFPLAVGDIDLSWGDSNNIAVFPVTMTYVDWYYIRPSESEGGIDMPEEDSGGREGGAGSFSPNRPLGQ